MGNKYKSENMKENGKIEKYVKNTIKQYQKQQVGVR